MNLLSISAITSDLRLSEKQIRFSHSRAETPKPARARDRKSLDGQGEMHILINTHQLVVIFIYGPLGLAAICPPLCLFRPVLMMVIHWDLSHSTIFYI